MTLRTLLAGMAVAPLLLAAAPAASVAGLGWPEVDARVAEAKSSMMASPRAALTAADAVLGIAGRSVGDPRRELAAATGGWLKGEALIRLNQPREAGPVIDAALAKARRTAPGSKLEGDLLKARGSLSSTLGLVQPALADFQAAYEVFRRAGAARSEAIVLQDIGAIYSDARDYEHVIKYYSQSAEVYRDDPTLALVAHNNLGNAYRESGRLADADRESAIALRLARATGSAALVVRILPNIVRLKTASGDLQAAAAYLAEADRLSQRDADARAWRRPFVTAARAELAWRRGELKEAAAALNETFAGQDLRRTPVSYRDAHETAARVYAAMNRPALALQHLRAFKRLDDETRELASSTNAALMGARFDFASQELKITRLRAGQLQRDVELARARARSGAVVGAVSTAAAALVLGLLLFGYIAMRRSRDAVRTANVRLASSNQALERALQAKTEFLATTSHEIRTPLNGVLGMAQVILADRTLGAAVRARIELVRDAGETMRSMVDDLLDVAKLETGRVTIARTEVDLPRLLNETLAFWRGQAEAKGVALTLETEALPARVLEDGTRLRQVLSNLVSNALKFTDAGSVTVRAVTVGGRLVLTVADTGIGLAEADLERIFEPFTQVDSSTTRRFSGTGLGLAICRDVAQHLGGSVTVTSRLGHGSTFTVDLPLTVLAAEAEPEAIPVERPAGLHEAVALVLEPNPLARSILRAVLQAEMREVRLAADLAAAEGLLAEGGVHLVVAADSALDPQAGPQGAERLVAAARGASVTVLTPAAPASLGAVSGAGVAQVLQRPIGAEDLLAALRPLVGDADAIPGPDPVVQAA